MLRVLAAVTALNNKVVNNAVEGGVVVLSCLREVHKVGHGFRSLSREEPQRNIAHTCVDNRNCVSLFRLFKLKAHRVIVVINVRFNAQRGRVKAHRFKSAYRLGFVACADRIGRVCFVRGCGGSRSFILLFFGTSGKRKR